jgi:hypothetical protein
MRLRSNFPEKHSCPQFLPSMNLSLKGHPRQRPLLTGRIAVRWMVRKADMPTQKLTPEIITAAIQGFEFQKTSIDGKIAQLRALRPRAFTWV